jgi:hypothetical protein
MMDCLLNQYSLRMIVFRDVQHSQQNCPFQPWPVAGGHARRSCDITLQALTVLSPQQS